MNVADAKKTTLSPMPFGGESCEDLPPLARMPAGTVYHVTNAFRRGVL